jgi:TonB-linked SusC/RagA family outer membrane protein
MRKILLFLSCVLLLLGRVAAQSHKVTGTVLDANGAPVVGASVVIKGTSTGTSTGNDGGFSLMVPSNGRTMIISAINFATLQFAIPNKEKLGVMTLQAGNQNLNEVVVVAYGQAKKTNVTGSVSMIKGSDIADKPFTSPDKALQGAVAGVEVSSVSGAPGSATDIRIRGIGSITASASPLWVIDGVEATTGDQSTQTTTSNVLATLNPDDIESISVLKDAASTAVYGSRASNGVIIVTTKKGRAGKTRINFNAEVGQNSQAFNPSDKPETSTQYQTTLRQGTINAGYATDNASADAFITSPNGFGYPSNWPSTNTNWRNVVTQNGNQSQYNLSVSGGTDKTQVYFSGGYFNQIGTSIASDFKRYNGTIEVTQKVNDKLTFSATMMTGYSLQHTPFNGGAYGNPILESFLLLPWETPRNPDGSLRFGANDSLGEFPLAPSVFNPLVEAAYNFNTYRQTSLRGNVQGVYKILDNLSFTSRYSGEYSDISEDEYWNPFYGDGYSSSVAAAGRAFSAYTRIYDWTWANFVDFKQKLNADNSIYFDLKPGYEAYEYNNYNLQAAGKGFPQTLGLKYVGSAATPITAFAVPTASSTISEFVIGDVNIKDRYVISGSYRRDGSSVFGADHKYGSFFSVGGAWNVNEEDFMKSSTWLSLLKLRASYGSLGNQLGFGLYTPLATYGYGQNYNGLPGSYPNNVGNPNLTWEKNKTFNIATDFGILKDRITGTVEWYDRKTTNLLLGVPLSLTSGVISNLNANPTQLENVGALSNKGIEVTLGGKPVVTRDFSWTVSFNIAHNTNRVTELYQGQPVPSPAPTGNNPPTYFQYTVGHDFQTYYMPQWAGVNPSTGAPLWYTDNTRKAVTSNYSSAAFELNDKYTATPKIFGSFTNDFTYKGFSLDVQFNYNFGNYLYDTWGFITNSDGAYLGYYNQMNRQLQAWTTPGEKASVPQIIQGRGDNSNGLSTRYLNRGDFIRLRNVQLSYAIPKSAIDKLHITNASLYIRGTNLLTFATDKYLSYDPEAGSASATNFEEFIPKTIAGGIKIGF